MLARFSAKREWRAMLVVAVALGLSGCGGLSKMQDILTDKPANSQQSQPRQQQQPQPASAPKPGTAQQPSAAAPPADPLPLPPTQ